MPGDLTSRYRSPFQSKISKSHSSILPTIRLARPLLTSRQSRRLMFSRFTRAFLFIVLALFLFASLAFLHPPSRAYIDPWTGDLFGDGGVERDLYRISSPPLQHNPPGIPIKDAIPASDVVSGGVIMGKLGNATAKVELGRATWKLLHTMTLRFPENPTEDQRNALSSYFHLFSRLYPCGECAHEFQQLLKKYPPQTSSRRAAATWLCFVHNEVNTRLLKPLFDCANLDATYDCGCGDDPVTPTSSSSSDTQSTSTPDTGVGVSHDPMDLEIDPTKDRVTGVEMIKGGK
ncbi:unnamed protein product [Somion occarium]|uniref:Sulfhydryl oxidase n=1 Tax=Somion occarium TaxID=3059160 RepID=A0ABP1DVA5_9APHY